MKAKISTGSAAICTLIAGLATSCSAVDDSSQQESPPADRSLAGPFDTTNQDQTGSTEQTTPTPVAGTNNTALPSQNSETRAQEDDSAQQTDSTDEEEVSQAVHVCQVGPGCTTASDCAVDTGALRGENYSCTGGNCIYLGCSSPEECETSYSSSYTCASVSGQVNSCKRRCSSPSDCASDEGAYSSDNYSCQEGACVYQGCSTTAECDISLPSQGTVCASIDGATAACVPGCTTPSDCVIDGIEAAAYQADKYACSDGICSYLGCSSSAECESGLSSANYVCR